MSISYDPKCEELARFFLETQSIRSSEDQVTRLAGKIQQVVEEFLECEL